MSELRPDAYELLKHTHQLYRSRWAREDDLINHRITWLGVSQAIMAAAYGLTFQLDVDKVKALFEKNPEAPSKLRTFVDMIPVVGMAISFTILLGVLAAILAAILIHRKWRKEWECITNQRARGNPDWQRMRIYVSPGTTALGFVCALFMPFAFFMFWHAVKYQPAWMLNI